MFQRESLLTARLAAWLLGGLVLVCALVGFLSLGSLAVIEARVIGLSGPLALSDDGRGRVRSGERLAVAWDRAMPRGYERIYLHRHGEIIGFLPESPTAVRVREALANRQPVQVAVAGRDWFGTGQGLKVRVTFEPDRSLDRYPLAVQALDGDYSLGMEESPATESVL